MKPLLKHLLIALSVFLVQISFGQNKKLDIVKSQNPKLIRILNDSDLLSENMENNLSVRVYKIDNGSGSAGFESGEVSHNLLVAVSEFAEEPNQSLFEIGPFYDPKFSKWYVERESEKAFEVEYGIYDHRKTIKLKVNISELQLE